MTEMSDGMRSEVVAAIAKLWDEGCPVASRPDEIAPIAIRRWISSERRGVKASDFQARVQDLTKGLVAHFEKDPALVGPLRLDYERVAECVANLLSERKGRDELARVGRLNLKVQLKHVARILWIDWDPIRVNVVPEAFGEYDSYAPSILSRVLHGAAASDLDHYLSQIETENMGLSASPASSRALAVSKLLALGSGELEVYEGPDILASVKLFRSEDGGRSGPVFDGYRPQHLLLDEYQTSGTHTYLDCVCLKPGETAKATISFVAPEAYLRSLKDGDVVTVSEGSRVVGHATVLEVLNAVLQRA